MAQWKKLLVRMLEDTDPRNYSYEEAAQVLEHLGFALAPVSGVDVAAKVVGYLVEGGW